MGATFAVLLVVVSATAQAATQAPTGQTAYQAALNRLDGAMTLIDRAEGTIDQAQLDPVALVGGLDADPKRIAVFVRTRIAYQPYPGALRGVKGTLMARAGNALDQSMLLAALLHDAGYDARIDYAPLDDAQARQVLAQAGRLRAPAPPPVDATALAAVAKAVPNSNDPALKKRLKQAMQPPVYAGPPATVMAAWLEKALVKAGVKLDGGKMSARLFRSAHDYFWVEYRSDPWAKWHAVQPVFAEAKHDFGQLKPKERYYVSLPERWQWRLHLELVMEAKRGSDLDTAHLLDWTRPVANLAGKPLSIGVAPTNLSSRAAFRDLKKTFAQAQLYSASFNGAQTGPLFDLTGNTVDPEALSGGGFGAAGVFMTANKKEQAAAGALANLGGHSGKGGAKPLPIQVLTGVWIEVTVIPPDGYGKPRHQRRYLLDRIGDTQRRAEKITHLTPMKPADIARRLTSSYTFVASGGRPAAGLLIQRYIAQIKRQRPLLRYALELGYLHKDDGVTLAQYLQGQKPAALTQFGLFRLSADENGKTYTYRPAPSIVAVENGFGKNLQSIDQTDILFDPVAMLPTGGSAATAATSATALPATVEASSNIPAALVAGVHMTRFETAHRNGKSKTVKHISAYGQLAVAYEADTRLGVIKPGEDDGGWSKVRKKVAALKLPPASRDAVLRDLHEGFVVAIPHRQNSAASAWWRVNPGTGEALGMTADDRGGDLAEYAELFVVSINRGMTLGGAVVNFVKFMNCKSPCCKARAVAATLASVAGSMGISSAVESKLLGALGAISMKVIMTTELSGSCHT